jgi:hypothetical protein
MSDEQVGFDQVDKGKPEVLAIRDGNDRLQGILADEPRAEGGLGDAEIAGGFIQPVGRLAMVILSAQEVHPSRR